MKHLSFLLLLLLLSVFLASCGQEVAPPIPSPVAPVKTEVSAPVIEKEVAPIVESNSWVTEKTVSWALSSSWSTNEVSFSDAQIQDILAKIESYMNSLNARANTGSLVVGDYSAQYNQSQSWDTIDVNINGVKSTIEGIWTKKEINWIQQCNAIKKKLDCNGKNNYCTQSNPSKNRICENTQIEWIDCFGCGEGGEWVAVNAHYNRYDEMLDFSPSGKYILVYVGRPVWAEVYGVVLIDTKNWKQVLDYDAPYNFRRSTGPSDSGIIYHIPKDNQDITFFNDVSYEWWTPDKSRYMYISQSKDNANLLFLNITKVDTFPSIDSIKLDSNTRAGWNDDQYVYLLSEKDSIKKLTIFSITDLKEVFSKELK